MENDIKPQQNEVQPSEAANADHRNNTGKVWIALLSVVAICGIAFGIYGIFFANQKNVSREGNPESSVDTTDSDIAIAYESRDLREKTLRLLGKRNGFLASYDSDEGTFIVLDDYMPIAKLLNNELTNEDKVYIMLETTSIDNNKTCSPYDDKILADMRLVLGDFDIRPGDNFDCISYKNASLDFYDLFGEDLPKVKQLTQDYIYGENSENYYYHIMGGRGGIGYDTAIGRIKAINTEGDIATVEIALGGLSGSPEGFKVRHSILQSEYFEEFASDIEVEDITIEEEQYEEFDQYRFVFKKNGGNIYSFEKVEQP